MNSKKRVGYIGEKLAVEYLENNGYIINKTNFYSKYGEIDIIASLENVLVFVEVKTRTNLLYGEPIDSINKRKLMHMINSAKNYMYINKIYNRENRFDVIEVYLSGAKCKINHIKDILN